MFAGAVDFISSGRFLLLAAETSTTIRARHGAYNDYWLLDVGILRIKIISPFVYVGAPVAWVVLFEGALQWILPAQITFVTLFGVLTLCIVAIQLRVSRKRARLSEMPIQEVLQDPKLSNLIPWSEIVDVQVLGRDLSFRTSLMTYAAKLDESDTVEATEFIQSKVGDRPQASRQTVKQPAGQYQLEQVDWSKLNYFRGRKIVTRRRAGIAVWVFIALVLINAYLISTRFPDVNFTVASGGDGDCSQVSFIVRNMGLPTLHSWAANVSISPRIPIAVNPASVQLEPLASGLKSSQHVFAISFAGVPSGVYQLRVNVLNGTRVAASSAPISCNVLKP
jgi:hypothetical protein